MELKLKDWKEGNYTKQVTISTEQRQQLEAEIIKKLVDGDLPQGAFVISVRLDISVGIQGSVSELQQAGWLKHVVTWEYGDLDLKSKKMKVNVTKAPNPFVEEETPPSTESEK